MNTLPGEVVSPSVQDDDAERIADLELALDLALAWLGEQEPPDSRAFSNEFVAMAAIRCEQDRLSECRTIIQSALAIANQRP